MQGEQVKKYEFKPRAKKPPRHNSKKKLQGRMEPSSNLTKEYNIDKFKNQGNKNPAKGQQTSKQI